MAIVQTIWEPKDGNGEYVGIAEEAIVDPTDSSIALVDPSGVAIVSTDVEFTGVPQTIWTEDESL